jgi:hypothetical protein
MEVHDQLYALATLPQGKSPRYPLNMRLGGPQNLSGLCGEEEIYDLPVIDPGPFIP